jgi:hypothetical protein
VINLSRKMMASSCEAPKLKEVKIIAWMEGIVGIDL